MDIDTALLRRTGLFQGMEDGDIRRLLDCLHCPVRRYGRGEFLWHAGDAVPMAGIVDRKSTRLNSSHLEQSRMPSSA